ncbi:MAG TPA: HAD-IA family hydrolase [Acidimicrobiales bacterium]|nr:HAD-IA family hydrolase [Acidimicrobiales bacterium]
MNEVSQEDVHCLIFDFDGLVLDTETPDMVSWQEEFSAAGVALDLDRWMECIGSTVWFDLYDELEKATGNPVDRSAVRSRRQQRYRRLLAAEELRPGVQQYLDDAEEMGMRLGIASSSTRDWVQHHLSALGIAERFHVIRGRDDVGGVAKPAPDVYLKVVEDLGVSARQTVALEDSPNGVRAAKAAGIRCAYVPNGMTLSLPSDDADWVLESLAAVPLQDLLARP